MEISSSENLQQPSISSNDTGPCHNDKVADDLNHRHGWDKLQGMLSFQLKQVMWERVTLEEKIL